MLLPTFIWSLLYTPGKVFVQKARKEKTVMTHHINKRHYPHHREIFKPILLSSPSARRPFRFISWVRIFGLRKFIKCNKLFDLSKSIKSFLYEKLIHTHRHLHSYTNRIDFDLKSVYIFNFLFVFLKTKSFRFR